MKDLNLITKIMERTMSQDVDCGIESVDGIIKFHVGKVLYVGSPKEVVRQIISRLK